MNLVMRRLNSEVQQTSRRMGNLQWSFVSMPFAWSRAQFVGDPIALFLGRLFMQVPLGKYCLGKPLRFALLPRSQE